MTNPLLAGINRAIKDNKTLGLYFARYLGTKEHPRGRILSEYRTARRAMETSLNLPQRERQSAARETLLSLETAVTATIIEAISESAALGIQSAEVQTQVYADNDAPIDLARVRPNIGQLAQSPLAQLQQQITAILSLIAIGASVEEIIGGGGRLGLLQPAPIQRELATWMGQALSNAFDSWLVGDTAVPESFAFRRQAIAAIDERTTDCCLKVHGQIVGLKEDFTLTGTPRFADKQRDPPFHNYCRTSVTLYLPSFDEGFTEDMIKASRLEREARQRDNYVAPHPVNAFTRVRR